MAKIDIRNTPEDAVKEIQFNDDYQLDISSNNMLYIESAFGGGDSIPIALDEVPDLIKALNKAVELMNARKA